MQPDVWYDLVLRELTSGSDVARERRKDAEAAQPVSEPAPDTESPEE